MGGSLAALMRRNGPWNTMVKRWIVIAYSSIAFNCPSSCPSSKDHSIRINPNPFVPSDVPCICSGRWLYPWYYRTKENAPQVFRDQVYIHDIIQTTSASRLTNPNPWLIILIIIRDVIYVLVWSTLRLTTAEDVYIGEVMGQVGVGITVLPGVYNLWQCYCEKSEEGLTTFLQWSIVHWLDPQRMVSD